ncbi:MAG: molybdopterin-dependent oxidoreductase [Candidatus Acetothermia bacterium]|jgi:hypothetical protein|nr:molybdopterin-dependent oxidoreductase [Candidatus Acetothermia bacterium]MDH7505395.1 molybdopterin-dependent oxidoreductase [Candidatus Acetothermia bacterium]
MEMKGWTHRAGLGLVLALALLVALWPSAPSQSELAASETGAEWALTLTIDGAEAKFTLEEIEALPSREVEFHEHIYRGTPLRTLLTQAGVDIGRLEAVKAIAADGYRLEYERRLVKRFDFILAYEADGKPLPQGEGPLRIVFPGGRSAQMMKMVERLIVKLGEWRLTLVAKEEREFTLPELERLPAREVQADSKIYKGIPLEALLLAAGVDLGAVQTASVMASSGYFVDYGREALSESEPLLAYELDGGPLPAELGALACLFRGEVQVKAVERVIVAFKAE